MPEKLLRAPRLKRRLRPNFMVKVPSISWWRRFCSVRGRSLGCRRRWKPPPKPPPFPPDFLRIDLGGESRLGEAFLLEESPLPPFSLASLLPLLLWAWWWRVLWEAFERHEVIFERLPVSRDEVLESGTLGVGEVPAGVPAAAAVVVSSPSSLRAVEEEEEKDFRTMRCQVSRIAMLGFPGGVVRVSLCACVTNSLRVCSSPAIWVWWDVDSCFGVARGSLVEAFWGERPG